MLTEIRETEELTDAAEEVFEEVAADMADVYAEDEEEEEEDVLADEGATA